MGREGRRDELPLLPLRDELALDRTELANHRTWLAEARTGLALFISGASFVHFFDAGWIRVPGWLFMGLSAPVVGVGYYRYRQQHRKLGALARAERERLLED